MTNAFLLSRQSFDTKKGVRLEFWFSSDGGPLKVVIDRQRVLFFIRQLDFSRAEPLLSDFPGVEFKSLDLKNFASFSMTGVYFISQQHFYRARDILKKHDISCLESDIRATDRYLTERFLTGPVAIQIDDSDNKSSNHPCNKPLNKNIIHNPKIMPEKYQPDFDIMSFDIETDYKTNQLFSIAFVTNDTSGVFIINENSHNNVDEQWPNKDNIPVEFVDDETMLLNRFLSLVDEFDPDVFIGWNVINFDFRFLQNKADELGIPLAIGRHATKAIWRQQQNNHGRYFLLIPGRVVLDGIDTLKSATYSFSSFSLENVGRELLGRGKLIHNIDPNEHRHDPLYKAKEIRRQFYEAKLMLAAYNLEDCQLVWDIFKHTDLINFAIERARLTGLEMDRMGGSVAAFDNLYLPRLHRKGYIAPNIGDYAGRLSAPGGYVMNSVPGMHNSVLVLDYKSLYPSIIRTFKVDPYARIIAELVNANNASGEVDERNKAKQLIPGYDGASFSKTEHILPEIIEQLWDARDVAKQDNNQSLSQAIKIIMNSFYGVLGTPGCRMHDSRLTSSITKRSHDVILKTVELIEKAGYAVIYGDTDSVFVSLQSSRDNLTASKIGKILVESINRFWMEELDKKYGIESYLEMEFETHFNQFFMPTIRGSEKGSKKRYAGLVIDNDGKQTIIFKGLETVRTDWTALAKEFQKELYRRVFNNEPYKEYIRHIVQDLKAGHYDDDLIYRKRLRQKLSEYQKNIPPHAQAAIKAENYFERYNLPSRYKNSNWIEYVITLNGPETLECKTSTLNYLHYVEKQLTPIADTILSTMGSSMKSVIQDQYELF